MCPGSTSLPPFAASRIDETSNHCANHLADKQTQMQNYKYFIKPKPVAVILGAAEISNAHGRKEQGITQRMDELKRGRREGGKNHVFREVAVACSAVRASYRARWAGRRARKRKTSFLAIVRVCPVKKESESGRNQIYFYEKLYGTHDSQ
ncbi:hypothetical protein L6452_41935 [Arctium lappa]|uniref:Uncharacterized protein n=1 Tax=Arctium lappa TaxID=4217 RepID=A0ACB8XHA5_ARCLA|nr:hypothetical protein L6452_41935 [Arctium lappa]